MRQAIVVDVNDVKKILAEKFNVPVANIIKAQYSYTIIKVDDGKVDDGGDDE